MNSKTKSMQPQDWFRDTARPCLSLGNPDCFDNMHIFAPYVVYELSNCPHIRQSLADMRTAINHLHPPNSPEPRYYFAIGTAK